VVEGYFDVLRAVQAGVDYTVAPLGTALTTEQVALLKRYAKEVVLLYDNDSAGNKASFRAADELLRAGVRSLIATLPEGEDPDSLVGKGGPEALQGIVRDAMDVFERMLQLVERKGWLADLAGRRRALDRLLPALRATKDPVTRDLYVSRAAEALGVAVDSIRREMNMAPGRRPPPRNTGGDREQEVVGAGNPSSPERNLTRVLAREPKWRVRVKELVPDLSILAQPDRELFRVLSEQPPEVDGAELLSHVDGVARSVLESVLREDWGVMDVDALIDGSLRNLESRSLLVELEEKRREIAMASEERKKELAREIDSLSRRLNKLKPGRWNVIRTGRSSAG
ncbi:MAG: toprim domain-containing protein, partial [Gemmatimonadota bacterium]|nr:toprim domain-containing protein [Gemmatimonadota bacterium]